MSSLTRREKNLKLLMNNRLYDVNTYFIQNEYEHQIHAKIFFCTRWLHWIKIYTCFLDEPTDFSSADSSNSTETSASPATLFFLFEPPALGCFNDGRNCTTAWIEFRCNCMKTKKRKPLKMVILLLGTFLSTFPFFFHNSSSNQGNRYNLCLF